MYDVNVKNVDEGNLRLRQLRTSKQQKEDFTRRTLVIFFSWLGASTKALDKYFDIYHSLGHDILHVPGTVTHFAWPPTSVTLATRVLDYIGKDLSHYKYLLVHSTSIGSYNYTSCLMLIKENPVKYWNFHLRLVGCIFDSITYGSYDRMRIGVSFGVTTNNLLRILLQQFLAFYFVITKSKTVNFYELGMKVFVENQVKVPSIFFFSKDDPLCDHELIDEMVARWRKILPVPVLSVCWDTSVHAGHLFKNKDDYMNNHAKFMNIVKEFCMQEVRKVQQICDKSKL